MRAAVIVCATLAFVACSPNGEVADLVFVNAQVITVDSTDRVAQAVP